MRIPILVIVTVLFIGLLPPPASAAFQQCGNSTDITRSANTNENAPVYAKTYTIDTTFTVTSSTQIGIVICASVAIVINGTLTVQGLGGAGGAASGNSGGVEIGRASCRERV